MTPQQEAIGLLSEAIAELTSSTSFDNLRNVLRKCQHASELVGWEDQKRWFHQELNGLYAGSVVPEYRKIASTRIWRTKHFSIASLNALVLGDLDASCLEHAKEQTDDILEVWIGIDWILTASKSGYAELTGETKRAFSEADRKEMDWERVRIFQPSAFLPCLNHIERATFDFASNAYVALRYGNAIADIWSTYRVEVDAAIGAIGLADHLTSIQSGLQSENPASWRLAVFGCRNLLKDVADYLWKDTRPTYAHLLGQGVGGKLEVTSEKFGNRLSAYIHQKSLAGTRGKFFRAEAGRLADSLTSLISLQSEAHDPIELRDARSISIATYCLLGELVTRTDMVPVREYASPARSADE